jgi:2-polyprenyl-3-methyl-5-hydroxy-6-metoxy-1,4-benzoquinol methylase
MGEISQNKYFKANKENWNDRVSIHKDSSFYDLKGFRAGKNMLNSIELDEVGDVSGKSLLHLQCHFGLDTMSWARLGAKITGVDFSNEAIEVAKSLSAELDLNANFVCCNVYDLKEHLTGQFDVVFASYGVIGWLPDLDIWAEIVHHFLKPGGMFYLAEFHPVVWMFDDDFTKLKYSYFNEGVIEIDQEGTYADKNSDFKHKEYSWNHPMSEVVNALLRQGLQIELLNEYDYSPYDCFPDMIKNKEGNFQLKDYKNILPMVYTIRARKSK